jgi:acyl-CoA synthetase (AMP-forming)/AMP-acid ligase II
MLLYLHQVDADTDKQYTYAQVIDRIQRLAAGLKNLGLRQGDVLCALTFNTIEYPIIWYAVNLIGATFQTASPLYVDGIVLRLLY